MRQQVEDEAAADLEVHRQMRPAADGDRGKWGKSDGVNELMGTVAKLRLRSALEELEARSAHPGVRNRLLNDLLIKVQHVLLRQKSFI